MKNKTITIISLSFLFVMTSLTCNMAQQVQFRNNYNSLSVKQLKDVSEQIMTKFHYSNKSINQFSNIGSQLDSAIVLNADGESEKHTYSYYNGGKWSNYLMQRLIGSNWTNVLTFNYTYNSNGNLTSGLGKIWNNNSWQDQFKYTMSYNDKNLITESISDMLVNGNWVNSETSTFTYSSNEKVRVEIRVDSYFGTRRFTETYDDNWNKISILKEKEDGGIWQNSNLTTFTYDTNNSKISELLQEWNGSVWGNIEKRNYEYDANKNMISETSSQWLTDTWIFSYKNTIEYNSNNYMISNLSSIWDGSEWVNNWKFSYQFTADGNSLHGISEEWNYADWQKSDGEFHIFDSKGYYTDQGQSYLYDGIEINAYYSGITAVKGNALSLSNFTLSQNYPNPFNPTSTISYSLPEVSDVSIKIYDIKGTLIKSFNTNTQNAGNYNVIWNGKNANGRTVASGTYIYRMEATPLEGNSEKFIASKKMMLMK